MSEDRRKVWEYFRPYFRAFWRILNAALGFGYDFFRFYKYGGWRGGEDDLRNYQQAMVYHGLEKSMSYKERRKGAGWNNAFKLLDLIKEGSRGGRRGYNDYASLSVLRQFIDLPENKDSQNSILISNEIKNISYGSNTTNDGVQRYALSDFERGKLENPEDFFLTRYSLREFSKTKVDDEVLKRALRLALKTPSVCNRQAWHTYYTSDKAVLDAALKYQNGNTGFGHAVANLLVVTTDLKAFFAGEEHYQHWIDGGMFSMSVVHALHSLGVASCCLNWSQSPRSDMLLRKTLNINKRHTVMMLIAYGYPNEDNTVCLSSRKPLTEYLTELKKVSL